MAERISLIEEIKRGGYEASLITTFNSYLPFYEDVVLRKLQSGGMRHNILMMDAVQCANSIAHNPPHLAGRSYSLIPVKSAGAFHPKVILLVGKNKGSLLIGSHNLTLSGFGYNRELTNLVRVKGRDDQKNMALMQMAWLQIRQWVESEELEVPGHLTEMVLKISEFAPWLEETLPSPPTNAFVISTQPDSASLWEKLMARVGGTAKEVTVTGAFFDADMEFVNTVQEKLKPDVLNIIIDPQSVHIPKGKKTAGINFLNGSNFGSFESEEEASGYLHAKAICIQTVEGDFYLVTGSANPSTPAWLEPGLSRNIEMMLTRIGPEAKKAAKEMGLLSVSKYPPLTKSDWDEAYQNWDKTHDEPADSQVGGVDVAFASNNSITFQYPHNGEIKTLACDILGNDRCAIQQVEAHFDGEKFQIEFDQEQLSTASYLRIEYKNIKKTYIVHHQRQIEEFSRTGSQRLLRKALASLVTDSPDLETLIKCVDKIIFAKAEEVDRTTKSIKAKESGRSEETKAQKEPAELSIDVSETKRAIKKYRLRYSDNLAYLIDMLIYHLRIDKEEAVEVALELTDEKGRSEEEQIDADDDDQAEKVPGVCGTSEEILATCHSKVRTLVNRMIGQLRALSEEKVSFEDVLIRLTGILAVLRQLRNCDGKVTWVQQGQTTLPLGERKKLLEAILKTVFEQPYSILHPPEELQEVDELARLKGLVLWLAWDSGLQLIEKKPFSESVGEHSERLRVKAIMVSLVQLIEDDDVVSEEARQSIGPLCSSDMDWFSWILDARRSIAKFIEEPDSSGRTDIFTPGDVAYIQTSPKMGVRLLLSLEGDKVSLSYLGGKKDYLKYQQRVVKFASWDQLMPG